MRPAQSAPAVFTARTHSPYGSTQLWAVGLPCEQALNRPHTTRLNGGKSVTCVCLTDRLVLEGSRISGGYQTPMLEFSRDSHHPGTPLMFRPDARPSYPIITLELVSPRLWPVKWDRSLNNRNPEDYTGTSLDPTNHTRPCPHAYTSRCTWSITVRFDRGCWNSFRMRNALLKFEAVRTNLVISNLFLVLE